MKLRSKHLSTLLVTTSFATLFASPAFAAEITVTNMEELRAAVGAANPGDVILMQAGTYRLDSKLNLDRPGSDGSPIVIRAASAQKPVIESNTVEGFKISAPHWTLENLHFMGVCADDSSCEHALHIVREADNTTVRSCVFQNFNAQIKGNGEPESDGGPYVYPDDVLIEGSEFFNDAPRQTGNPVTPIDIVGGRRWVVRANFIHDHAKGGGNNISYAAFFKGNSRDGIFEQNLIACELMHTGQIRLGLSLGGGGTGPDPICEDGTCNPEHQNGILRNNLIVNCPTDVGIYLNEATNTRIEHNTLYNTTGIDVRFDTSSATLVNNLLDGKIRTRNGGTITSDEGNLQQVQLGQLTGWFTAPGMLDFSLVDGAMLVDKGSMATQVTDDYCGNTRQAPFDVGAIEYTSNTPCDTTSTHPPMPGDPMMEMDMGGMPPQEDMGTTPEQDMGSGQADMGSEPPAQDMSSGTPGEDDMGVASGSDFGQSEEDMSSSGPGEQPPENSGGDTEEGCQSVSSKKPGSPLGAMFLLLAATIGMIRRRRSSPRA